MHNITFNIKLRSGEQCFTTWGGGQQFYSYMTDSYILAQSGKHILEMILPGRQNISVSNAISYVEAWRKLKSESQVLAYCFWSRIWCACAICCTRCTRLGSSVCWRLTAPRPWYCSSLPHRTPAAALALIHSLDSQFDYKLYLAPHKSCDARIY